MTIRKSSFNFWIILSLIVLLAIIICIKFFDAEIALRIIKFLLSFRTLHKLTQNIPDILAFLVGIGTIIMWAIYFYRTHKKIIDIETKFLKLAATTLPVTYVLKTFLQFSFGRTNPRDWLLENQPLIFNWFHKLGNGSFPSGHMTVFAAFGSAVYIFYPQYRRIVFSLLFLLGFALIITDYHFLSDIIAGTYLGISITYFLQFLFERQS
jgi:membrane-associated phospholipid phosphatase